MRARGAQVYGSDRAAQNYGMSVQLFCMLGMEDKVQAQLKLVLEMMPQMEARNVHNSFMIVWPVLWVLKKRGKALQAREIFHEFVVSKFETMYEKGSSTPALPLYKPVASLLGLAGGMWSSDAKEEVAERAKLEEWLLMDETGRFSAVLETATLCCGRDGAGIVAEACLLLAERRRGRPEEAGAVPALVRKGLELCAVSLQRSRGVVGFEYANSQVEPVELALRQME